jgi:hypothetical protein
MNLLFKKITLVAGILIIMASGLKAQFNISGEFKMRGEYRGGYGSLLDTSKTPYVDILGRARIAFDYKNDKITTRFSLNDAWVFGQNYYSSDTITKNTINIFEAWFKYNFSKSFALKVGRTEVYYDDERLLGQSNWSMWGATHDILIAQYESSGANLKGDAGIAVNNTAPAGPAMSSYNMGRNYKYLAYLYLNKKFLDNKLVLSILGITDVFQNTNTANSSINLFYARATAGAGLLYTDKKWGAFLNGFYQGGHYRDGREIKSNFYAAWVSYQVIKALKLQVGYEHLSGNNFSDTTAYKTTVSGFSTLYGTSHRGYGYMDLFTVLVRDNTSPGLNDLYGRATVSFNDKMSLEATYRWFSLPYGYLSKPTKTKPYAYTEVSTDLGSEIDLMYIYKPVPNLELNAAYCFFMPTSTMESYDGLKSPARFAQYAYIMVTYKPNFFTYEKH